MKRARKWLLRFSLALVIGLAGIASLASVLVARPEWFLSRKSLPLLAQGLKLAGVFARFPDTAELIVESRSWRKKKIAVFADGVCFDLVSPHVSSCFKTFHAEVILSILPFRVQTLGPLTALGGSVRLETQSAGASPPPSRPTELPSWPQGLEMKPVRVEVDSLTIHGQGGDLVGKAAASFLPLALSASGEWKTGAKPTKFHAALTGETAENLLKARVEGWVENPIQEIQRITVANCGVELEVPTRKKVDARVLCPVDLKLAPNTIPREWRAGWDQTFRFLAHLDGSREIDGRASGTLEVDWLPLRTSLFHGQGKIVLPVAEIVENRFPASVETEVHLVDFQRVARILDTQSFAVPSPLNALGGEIRFATNGKAEIDLTQGILPFNLRTILGSKDQHFDATASGALLFRREDGRLALSLDLDARLGRVTLVLPPLDPKQIPRFLPDPRIRMPDTDEGPTTTFHYRMKVSTRPESPILLVSNLATRDVPLNLDLSFSDEDPVQGSLSVSTFPVRILRRNATVKYFRLKLDEESPSPPIAGEIEVRVSEYLVTILIQGTADKPRVLLQSDPPLSESDAYSVLIFGRPFDELSPNDGDTVANLRAAISNRAVTLASMYLLANTPIESVSYDPNSKAFSARIRVGDGTSLSVGSNFRALNQLGVKQRIGQSWMWNTYVDDPFGVKEKRSVSSMLEWSRRY